jgi:hypothetical protein
MAEDRLLRVRHWQARHENNRSRELKRTDWFPFSNELSADSYVDLVGHENGAAHLGVWAALLMVASKAKPRGVLVRDDGRPHNAVSLARVTRLPEPVIESAIARLLEIELLEVVENGSDPPAGIPHPDAGNPQEPAEKPQEGAAEGKGTEHHHQEGKGKEKENEGKRTEPEGTEGASTFSSESSGKAPGKKPSHIRPDDEEKPGAVYASPEDELKAIYRSKAGEPITIDLLTAIRGDLELSGVSFGAYLAGVKKHSANDWRNPPGFLRSLSKRFRAKTRPASDPITAADADEVNYRCALCGSTVRGEGLRLDGKKIVPCECASAEYIAERTVRNTFDGGK